MISPTGSLPRCRAALDRGKIINLALSFWPKDNKKGTEYLEVLLRYLTWSARNLPEKELNEAITQLFEERGEICGFFFLIVFGNKNWPVPKIIPLFPDFSKLSYKIVFIFC